MFAGLVGVLELACISPPPRPSDADLVLHFTRDSVNYQRVITMLAADTNIETIAPEFLRRVGRSFQDASAAEVGITQTRLAEYRRILDSLGVIHLTRWERDQVMFATWARGWAGNTHHRGIAWLSKPLPKLPSSIGGRRFRLIKGPWYMFED